MTGGPGKTVERMVTLNLVALDAAYLGGQWDAAMHARGEVDRFWYPPHYSIYFALLVAALLAAVGLLALLRAPGGPGAKVRGNVALTLIVAANAVSFSGAPLDAWWHETYGIDLSVWSPPHLHLLAGMVLAALAAAAVFLGGAPRPPGRWGPAEGRALLALAMALLLAAFLFFEYEAGLANAEVRARPSWTYPVLWTTFAAAAAALAPAALRTPLAATTVASLYVAARLAVVALDRALLGFPGALPYPLVLPALALDLALALPGARRGPLAPWPTIALGGLLAAGLVAASAPLYWSALNVLPALNVAPWASSWPLALAVGPPAALAGWAGGSALRRLRPPGGPEA